MGDPDRGGEEGERTGLISFVASRGKKETVAAGEFPAEKRCRASPRRSVERKKGRGEESGRGDAGY